MSAPDGERGRLLPGRQSRVVASLVQGECRRARILREGTSLGSETRIFPGSTKDGPPSGAALARPSSRWCGGHFRERERDACLLNKVDLHGCYFANVSFLNCYFLKTYLFERGSVVGGRGRENLRQAPRRAHELDVGLDLMTLGS